MRDITLCMAFYMNAGMLAVQYEHLAALHPKIKAHLRLIVVDDGSPTGPAAPPPADIGLPVSIYRIAVDVPWNQDAARNIAVHHAETEWVLLTDMDHMVPEETWRDVMKNTLDPGTAYRFGRVTAPAMTPYHPHPNSWLITKALFDRVGGYDERYSIGCYGTDFDIRDRLKAKAKIADLRQPLIRVPREHVPDASTTTLPRKEDAGREAIQAVKRQIAKDPGKPTLRLSFPYSRVA